MLKIPLLIFACLLCAISYSQIFISTDPTDTVREKSAAFEVKSRTGGFLPPRLSSTERKAIANPAQGLIVFDTTKQMFYGFVKGTGWRPFLMGYDTAIVTDAYSPVNIIDNQPGDKLGISVAIKGNIATAGAYLDNVNGNAQQGSLYVFRKSGEIWENIQKLTAPDGTTGDSFGSYVSMTDKYVFVAAYKDDIGENVDQGSVYVYKIQGDSLIYSQKLTSNLASANDHYGIYVIAKSNQLFIGSIDDDIGVNFDQGSFYYYALENNIWVEKQKVIQDSAAGSEDFFGYGISINDSIISVGHAVSGGGNYGYSQNAVFIYERVNGLWQRRQKINQPEVNTKTDAFGYATYLTDSTLTIGAWLKDEPLGNKDRGVMYLYKKVGNNWSYVKKFAPIDVNPADNYGDYFGVFMRGDKKYLVTGSAHEDIALGSIDKGAFYVYEWLLDEWALKKKIFLPNPTTLDSFGQNLDISNGNIIVSAANANNGAGKIYFYSIED